MPDSVANEYEWVSDVSITHMEILHGAFRATNPNALFCLRDSTFQADLPVAHRSRFVDEGALPHTQLRRLKEELRESFGPTGQVLDYGATFEGVDSTTGM